MWPRRQSKSCGWRKILEAHWFTHGVSTGKAYSPELFRANGEKKRMGHSDLSQVFQADDWRRERVRPAQACHWAGGENSDHANWPSAAPSCPTKLWLR